MSTLRNLVEATRNRELSSRDTLLNSALGMVCEAGEYGDLIKKHIFQGHPLDRDKCIRELGDTLWYLELAFIALGTNRREVEQAIVDKLLARYPNGFTEEASLRRADSEQ